MARTTELDITRVTYRWDDQPGVEPGWYCQSFAGDDFRDDSQKVWFSVTVDEYARGDEHSLIAALEEAFPAARIVEG
jgi:hypothetical protein